MIDTEPLVWHDGLLIGHTVIDPEHKEFANLIGALVDAPDEDLKRALDRVLSVARAHFEHEDKVMYETQFPPRGCHIDEHAAVLASMTAVKARLECGEIEPARGLADELVRWFPAHVQHLDSALAHWICKQTAGGKPLVFRRLAGTSLTRQSA